MLTLVGVVLQFGPRDWNWVPQLCQQVLLTVLFNMHRQAALPPALADVVFAAEAGAF